MPTTTPTRTLSLKPSLDWFLVLVPVAIVLELAGGPHATFGKVTELILAIFLVFMISVDGRSNWLEGAQLVGVYGIMAISLYFVQ